MTHRYLVALGSNVRHHRHGAPRRVLCAAVAALETAGAKIEACSPIITTKPLGPSRRIFANAALVSVSSLTPREFLACLQEIETAFGRSSRGRRWSARVLDLDIILWSGGIWADDGLTIPHLSFRKRGFVLRPACAVAPHWRDPISGLNLRHFQTRLTRPHPIPR